MTKKHRQLRAYRLYLQTDQERQKINKLITGETNYKRVVSLVKRYDQLQTREDRLKAIAYN